MSTRSAIIERTATGYRGIYCHFDGYISGVGKTLLEHYTDPAKVSALIDLGDCSIICGCHRVAPEGPHDFSKPEKGTVVAYMRDRGEEDLEPREGHSVEDVASQIDHNGYVYVFEDGAWKVNGRPLEGATEDED